MKKYHNRQFPRANALLGALPKAAILEWLNEYAIGREAMNALEDKLESEDTRAALRTVKSRIGYIHQVQYAHS